MRPNKFSSMLDICAFWRLPQEASPARAIPVTKLRCRALPGHARPGLLWAYFGDRSVGPRPSENARDKEDRRKRIRRDTMRRSDAVSRVRSRPKPGATTGIGPTPGAPTEMGPRAP